MLPDILRSQCDTDEVKMRSLKLVLIKWFPSHYEESYKHTERGMMCAGTNINFLFLA